MEVTLQWLDDIDDLLFVVFARWRSAARFGLALGLAAALVLKPGYGAELQSHWVVALSLIAFLSVLAWTSAAVPLARNSLQRSPAVA